MTAQAKIVAALRQKMQQSPRETDAVSTGVPALDNLLPSNGLRRGSLIEYLGGGDSLAVTAAQSACQDRPLILLDRHRHIYPASWGNLSRVVVLRPANDPDELWSLDQALRCVGVGAVLARCKQLDSRDFRRLQLAAELGNTVGLLIRPMKLKSRPTWADVQWLVEPQPSHGRWRLQVQLIRCRGGTGGSSVILEFDEQTNNWQEVDNASALHLPAAMADSTPARRRSGA